MAKPLLASIAVLLAGKALSFSYVVAYKPALMLCSLRSDTIRAQRKHRPPRQTLLDLDLPDNLHIVGRLDRDSEGLLLLTDNGMFTKQVLSPESHCPKTYFVLVKGVPSESDIEKLRTNTLMIRGSLTDPPISVRCIETPAFLPAAVPGMNRGDCWLEIIISEGKNRQIRRMTQAIGFRTVRLVRVQIGNYKLGSLQEGKWKYISDDDVLLPGDGIPPSPLKQ